MDIYGIITPTFCNQIKGIKMEKTIFTPGDFLSFFKHYNQEIENDFDDIFKMNFQKSFGISSKFEEKIILQGLENIITEIF